MESTMDSEVGQRSRFYFSTDFTLHEMCGLLVDPRDAKPCKECGRIAFLTELEGVGRCYSCHIQQTEEFKAEMDEWKRLYGAPQGIPSDAEWNRNDADLEESSSDPGCSRNPAAHEERTDFNFDEGAAGESSASDDPS